MTYVNEEHLAPGAGERIRLALLRDRALLRTLYATGLRREEISRLNAPTAMVAARPTGWSRARAIRTV